MQLEIKKSKFIGLYFPVKSQDEVVEILNNLKKEHKKATHICYAYRLTNPFSEKAFDDGEPSGTAGKPILNVLQKQDKKDSLLVVVRYFGGIKLGAGGLVRAYSKTASETLK
ncbi:MAG: YigZ family protein [Firmicutes bacterium]|nr:YigZ family protein [Bacillota bacterium]